LINFTNPAGMITQALSDVLGDKVIGICDSPIGLVRRACRALGIPPGEVQYDYAGINHLGWLTGLRHGGREVLPELLSNDALLRTTEEGRLFDPRLLASLRAIPNEYLYFYYAAREVTAALAGEPTRGEVILAEQDDFYRLAGANGDQAAHLWDKARLHREQTYLAEARTEQRDAQDLTGGGYEEVALDIAQAVTSNIPAELIVNARNGFTYPALPAHVVVETRSVVDGTGAHPHPGPTLALHQLGLIASVRAAEESIIQAAVDGDRQAAVHGFAIHPLVGSRQIAADLVESIEADEPSVASLLGSR
jgi:6-phospho-beta-glucosidase